MPNDTLQQRGLQYALESLKDFVPSRIFDSHLHLYRQADLKLPEPLPLLSDVAEVGAGLWRERVGRQSPNAQVVGGLFLPYPTATCDIARANEWLLAQLRAEPLSRGLLVISPRCDRARVDELARQPQIVGFKPYQLLSVETPTLQSSVGGFLPEWAWELADDRGLIIMLHLVRDKSMADPGNQEYIRSHCLKYPRARLILAHAARGFHARYTQTGITALRGLDNVWFDTAAVCEPQALSAVLHHFGPRKLLWGSDFPVSEGPSKCVSVADSFVWLDEKSVKWEELKIVCRPIPVGLESLLALKDAAEEFGLGREDLDDIFYRNALRLLGLWASAGAAASIISDFQKSGMMLPVQRGVAAEDGGQRGGAAGSLTQSLYRYAKTHRIPGGTQLLSKRPEMQSPDQWPAYFREARGCETWDLDGRHYFDMSFHGIGSCLLGFRDPDVTAAVRRRVNLGSMCTLNPPEEVELADLLCWLHPWAECVRYARCGGEIGAVAARIARATTRRSLVAICGYHGWQDWYLAANLGVTGALDGHLLPGLDPLGVPRELAGTALTFRYNQADEFMEIIKRHGDRLAAVVMEPCRYNPPQGDFLRLVRNETRRVGALLVFDEITIGWRLALGGAHLLFGVAPDMAIFAKALGNGHPIAAVIGTPEAMQGAHTSFISSTYWTESVGPTAALAALKKMLRVNVPQHVKRVGERITEFWQQSAKKHGLPVVAGDGFPCLAHFRFDHALAQELRTLYIQLMLERGFLAGISIYPTLAHTDDVVELYGQAIDEVFGEIAATLAEGRVKEKLKGPVAHTGFRRLL